MVWKVVTFLTSDLSSLSSRSFRLVANVDGEAQITAAVEVAEAAAFDEFEVAIWGSPWLAEQWRLDEVEVATKSGESWNEPKRKKKKSELYFLYQGRDY